LETFIGVPKFEENVDFERDANLELYLMFGDLTPFRQDHSRQITAKTAPTEDCFELLSIVLVVTGVEIVSATKGQAVSSIHFHCSPLPDAFC
jgi:hypothetical protein